MSLTWIAASEQLASLKPLGRHQLRIHIETLIFKLLDVELLRRHTKADGAQYLVDGAEKPAERTYQDMHTAIPLETSSIR